MARTFSVRRSGRTPRLLAFLAVLAASALPVFAQDLSGSFYVHEFWTELEPMVFQPGHPGPLTRAEAIKQVLTEAQFVFSGELYGFNFTYTPPDPTRAVAGAFTLSPIAEIKWGDPHLRVLATRVENQRFIAQVMYTLAPFQESWKRIWDSNIFPTASGRGSGNYLLGFDQRIASYRSAVEDAIHAYLSARILNRPKRVTGEVELTGNPYTIIEAGRFVSTVNIKVKIRSVEPYSVF